MSGFGDGVAQNFAFHEIFFVRLALINFVLLNENGERLYGYFMRNVVKRLHMVSGFHLIYNAILTVPESY